MKTFYTWLAIIFLTAEFTTGILAQAPNTWNRKANVGGPGRIGAVGFSIGSKGYIGTGVPNGNIYLRDFWEYDPATDVWTQKADFGGTGRNYACGFSIGDKGYIGTGQEFPTGLLENDFWEYDTAANTWTQKANFGGASRMQAIAFSIGNKGYLGTGFAWTGGFSDFWEYDPSTDTWNQKADFGGGKRSNAVGFSIGARGFVGTGISTNNNFLNKDFWEYNPDADAWTRKADFGGTGRLFASGFSIGAKGYIGTGDTVACYPLLTSDFWEYDVVNDVWTQLADYGGGLSEGAFGFSIRGKGYMGGDAPLMAFSDFWEYIPGCTLPAPPTISGTPAVCQGARDVSYTVSPVTNATTYVWTLPPGARIASGAGTNSIAVNFDTHASSGNITVYGNNICGDGEISPAFAVTVSPVPETPQTINSGYVLKSNATIGNQWYFEGKPIPGATSQIYDATLTGPGNYWTVVTINGCSSDSSNHKRIISSEVKNPESTQINVYPVPNDGTFNLLITTTLEEPFSISIYNCFGIMIYQDSNVEVKGSLLRLINLGPVQKGVYVMILQNGKYHSLKKIVVNK